MSSTMQIGSVRRMIGLTFALIVLVPVARLDTDMTVLLLLLLSVIVVALMHWLALVEGLQPQADRQPATADRQQTLRRTSGVRAPSSPSQPPSTAHRQHMLPDEQIYSGRDLRPSRPAQPGRATHWPPPAPATKTVQRTRHHPGHPSVLVVDVGVMGYSTHKVAWLLTRLPNDLHRMEPFVRLQAPTAATVAVCFELFDTGNNAVFAHEVETQLDAGITLVWALERLHLNDQHNVLGDWRLLVRVNGTLLAEHHFEFVEAISRYLEDDGEIDTERLKAIRGDNERPMSIDETASLTG